MGNDSTIFQRMTDYIPLLASGLRLAVRRYVRGHLLDVVGTHACLSFPFLQVSGSLKKNSE